jgi:hypothetical protein
MNTITETIPTAFAPETAFALSVHPGDQQETIAQEHSGRSVLNLPSPPNREWPGIPDSALND